MNCWKPYDEEGGIVQLSHPRTGSESVRHTLKNSEAGTLFAIERQHRFDPDHPYLADPAYQVVVNIRNPFDVLISWYQARKNTGDKRSLPEIILWYWEYQDTFSARKRLFYMLDLADTVLVTERLTMDWKDKVQSRWPVADMLHRNSVQHKRPWLNYYVECPEAISIVWDKFESDCVHYEEHVGLNLLPRP